jgi:hypothetical protein
MSDEPEVMSDELDALDIDSILEDDNAEYDGILNGPNDQQVVDADEPSKGEAGADSLEFVVSEMDQLKNELADALELAGSYRKQLATAKTEASMWEKKCSDLQEEKNAWIARQEQMAKQVASDQTPQDTVPAVTPQVAAPCTDAIVEADPFSNALDPFACLGPTFTVPDVVPISAAAPPPPVLLSVPAPAPKAEASLSSMSFFDNVDDVQVDENDDDDSDEDEDDDEEEEDDDEDEEDGDDDDEDEEDEEEDSDSDSNDERDLYPGEEKKVVKKSPKKSEKDKKKSKKKSKKETKKKSKKSRTESDDSDSEEDDANAKKKCKPKDKKDKKDKKEKKEKKDKKEKKSKTDSDESDSEEEDASTKKKKSKGKKEKKGKKDKKEKKDKKDKKSKKKKSKDDEYGEAMTADAQRQLAQNVQPQFQLTFRHYHDFGITSFATPTSCDVCGKMLVGLWNQGYACSACNQTNVHEACMHVPISCQPNADTCRVGGAKGAVAIQGAVPMSPGMGPTSPPGMGGGQSHQARTPFGVSPGGSSPSYR